ncbi:DUF3331 domain-containing protein [Burkholderia multivorans]|uniref:DUF3331 domain-containing protein n=1 Tax=Burkholderia multivorans TaxID=87883 RepID=UPI001C256BFA|nr:DUF3331 domain-containing protein [Burkholderia multivorans]MBU9334081.1 DUF3331 domain-containing protein [Burkholderia multivorans]MDN7449944.1 DUF3331 domain-containing protein [Burkholderia multivorans]
MLSAASCGVAPRAIAAPSRSEVHVTILEYSTENLLVRWVESGRRHYGEQKWRRAVAKRAGRCAYSGRAIDEGDAVYRPTGRPRPGNHLAMIAADVLDAAFG